MDDTLAVGRLAHSQSLTPCTAACSPGPRHSDSTVIERPIDPLIKPLIKNRSALPCLPGMMHWDNERWWSGFLLLICFLGVLIKASHRIKQEAFCCCERTWGLINLEQDIFVQYLLHPDEVSKARLQASVADDTVVTW